MFHYIMEIVFSQQHVKQTILMFPSTISPSASYVASNIYNFCHLDLNLEEVLAILLFSDLLVRNGEKQFKNDMIKKSRTI